MNKLIKITLTIILFLCLADMPYGYYELVRFLALVGFGILAYQSYQTSSKTSMVVYGALALLFQPFFKVYLGREIWNVVDVIVGVGLIISLFGDKKSNTD